MLYLQKLDGTWNVIFNKCYYVSGMITSETDDVNHCHSGTDDVNHCHSETDGVNHCHSGTDGVNHCHSLTDGIIKEYMLFYLLSGCYKYNVQNNVPI